MSLPVSASVPDLAMTVPTGFAATLGIWFATATAILISEAEVARHIAKFRLFSAWRALPVFQGPAALREQQSDREAASARLTASQPADRILPELSCGLRRLLLGWA